jgi:putative flippase GtrA
MRADAAAQLLPLVEDDGWFFDTELLVLAERSGLRIHEVPVDWVDDTDSRVKIVSTVRQDLRGIVRLSRGLASGRIPVDRVYDRLGRRPLESPARRPSFLAQLLRFGCVGIVSTVAYALLYLLFATVMTSFAANFLALLLTAIANTAANRRFTFGVRGRSRMTLHQFQGLIVFGISWIITSGSLLELHAINPQANVLSELVVLTFTNVLATVLRFVLLRTWVFRDHGDRRGSAIERRVTQGSVSLQEVTTT